MKLHTELLRLKSLLVEELASQGCLPWRDLESVEADLSGGELVLRFYRDGFRFFPLLRRFAQENGLELASWDPEDKRCSLVVRESPRQASPPGPRVPGPRLAGRIPDYGFLKGRYASAVREAFGSRFTPGACLDAARVAWALERPDFTALWLEKMDKSRLAPGERVLFHLWEAFLVHWREARSGGRSFAYTRLHYGKVLSLDPGNFFALFNLGLVARAEGRKEEAVRFFRKALEARPWDREAARVLDEMRSEEN